MGQQAACVLTYAGRKTQGTASLEHKDLVFRGGRRLSIALKDITSAQARGGSLHVEFGGQRAQFEIGDAAPKWAARITNPPSRLDKLGVKTDMTVRFVGFDDAELAAEIRERGARRVRSAPEGGVDLVFFGANITEAETMAAGKRAGLVDVKVVSFSETHTAEKFVIPVAQRSRPSRVSPRRGKS